MSDLEVLQEIAKAPTENIDRHRFAELTKGEDPASAYQRLKLKGHVKAAGPPGIEEMKIPPIIGITTKGKQHIATVS